jgi:GNAT superfamily N-acetyltransferase
MPARIRAGRRQDGAALQEIERWAGERFRAVGLDRVADDEPLSLALLGRYADIGRCWVAVDSDDQPVGYAIVDVVDGAAHIEQISVQPDLQGSGIGRALIDRVRAWAAANGCSAITLSTFADVEWNGPLYAHLGFAAIPEGDIGPELRALRAAEARHGLDPARRVCMRIDLEP